MSENTSGNVNESGLDSTSSSNNIYLKPSFCVLDVARRARGSCIAAGYRTGWVGQRAGGPVEPTLTKNHCARQKLSCHYYHKRYYLEWKHNKGGRLITSLLFALSFTYIWIASHKNWLQWIAMIILIHKNRVLTSTLYGQRDNCNRKIRLMFF